MSFYYDMKRYIYSHICCFLGLLAACYLSSNYVSFCLAQQPASSSDPIYVVDIQKIINESVIGKAARNSIEEDIGKKRLVLEKMKLEIDKVKEETQKQATLLSPEALQNKQEQMRKKQTDLERAYEDQREEIARKNSESMGNVVREIRAAIKKIAEQNNYKLILEKDMNVVVYINAKYDISMDVVKLLDSEKVGL
jgi:outer membrane protein